MTSVVDITPPRPAPSPSFRQIQGASRTLEWLFTTLFVVFLMVAVFSSGILLFYQGDVIAIGPITNAGHPPPDFVHLRTDQKLACVSYDIGRALPPICLFWCLRLLFRHYARGQVFTARNASLIKVLAICLVVDAGLPVFFHLVSFFDLALGAAGGEIDRIWDHMAVIKATVLGPVVAVMALVMQAGHEIEEDREGFV
jgi:hypothetical protein